MRRWGMWVVTALAAVQVVVGLVWWLANLTAVPAYGDTPEYFRLADDLRVDGYRTLAYPLLVRVASVVSEPLGVPLQVPIYLLQTAAVTGASWYLIHTVAPAARRGVVAFMTAVVVTSPLALHYATSVLSDSLAASGFVVALTGLARVVIDGDVARRTLAITVGAALSTALLRTEKATVLLVLAIVAGIACLVVRRRQAGVGRRWLPVAAVLVLALPALLGSAVNRATQTTDYGRPEAGAAPAAVSRIVWPHLSEVRGDLPADVRAQISAEEAAAFDEHNNNALPMTQRMLEMDDGGSGVVRAALAATLRCCAVEVAATAGADAIEYAFAPVTFAVEGTARAVTGDDSDTPTAWNITRMSAHRPDLSRAFLAVGFVLLPVLVTAAVTRRRGHREPARSGGRRQTLVLATVWLGTVVNGCFFAAAQGADANVRYGLSSAVVLTAALAVLALTDRPAAARPPALDG
ncbi:hypothetical protein [Modestobacter sp. VKM Ac-2978]|uniref:hypothetical protein n=1 Tax=Modestobacter sp. VKM Ac-2978 TaxID=3004132 RepID=UPI0022AA7A99|nr:hypothetical protein [Modestobacter sp. VKM Ac-2978]MCZ2849958.1 hypothetical protein [Modestobacter sp. VKM Ac-2978]